MLGGVGLRGGRPNRGRGAPGDGLTALEAEAGAPREFCATGAAGEREAGAAAEAEPARESGCLAGTGDTSWPWRLASALIARTPSRQAERAA